MCSYRLQCQLTTLSKARDEGHLFVKLKWPNTDLRVKVKRLYSLLTIKESASSIPKNLEARRRLEFFTNSLFMKMPRAKPVREMLSFNVFTPYYSEVVLYIMAELLKKNEDGISILFYLQKICPDEWKNFLARIGRDENALETELYDRAADILELRFWASYRGQTLSRTGERGRGPRQRQGEYVLYTMSLCGFSSLSFFAVINKTAKANTNLDTENRRSQPGE